MVNLAFSKQVKATFAQNLAFAAITLATVTAATFAFGSCFNKSKPEPERNCKENGVAVACPDSIRIIQTEIDCIDRDGQIKFKSGEKLADKDNINGVTAKVSRLDIRLTKMYEIELTIPAGVIGFTKALDCYGP